MERAPHDGRRGENEGLCGEANDDPSCNLVNLRQERAESTQLVLLTEPLGRPLHAVVPKN